MKKIDIGAALSGHLQEASLNEEVDPNVDVRSGPALRNYGEVLTKTQLEASPNFVRLVEAYEGFKSKSIDVPQCIARLDKILHILNPGLRMFHLPVVQDKIFEMEEHEQALAVATFEHTQRVAENVDGMIGAMRDGDAAQVTACFKKARSEFKAIDKIQDKALKFAHELIAEKRVAEEEG